MRDGEQDMNVCCGNASIYDLHPEKYVIIILRKKGMRVLVVGRISRKLAAVETWTDAVKGASISRVEKRKKMGPEQMFKLLHALWDNRRSPGQLARAPSIAAQL